MLFSILKTKPQPNFGDAATLYQGLLDADNLAIQYVQNKIWKTIFSMARFAGLTEQVSEEILTDSVMILLQKTHSGDYQFQGYDPSSFAVEIAKRLIANAKRKLKHQTEDIEQTFSIADESTQRFLEIKENEAIVQSLLTQINENCQKLIRLKYLEELSDEEIISQKLSQYTTINTLKVKRSECMKKLGEIAKNYLM